VTLDNWQSEGQLNWTFQHMAEIFPTVPIHRAPGHAPQLPRIGYEPDILPVTTADGSVMSLHTVMASTDTDGWMVIHDHPSWGAQVMVERYPSGMDPSTVHLMMSVTKSVVGIVVGGLFLGVMNTVLTESVMEATELPRAVASSTYSGVRFVGGAVAPALAGVIAAALGSGAPYWVGCAGLLIAVAILWIGRGQLARIDTHLTEEPSDEALALTAADA